MIGSISEYIHSRLSEENSRELSEIEESVAKIVQEKWNEPWFSWKTTVATFVAAVFFISAGCSFGQTVLLTSVFAVGFIFGKKVADYILPPIEERLFDYFGLPREY